MSGVPLRPQLNFLSAALRQESGVLDNAGATAPDHINVKQMFTSDPRLSPAARRRFDRLKTRNLARMALRSHHVLLGGKVASAGAVTLADEELEVV